MLVNRQPSLACNGDTSTMKHWSITISSEDCPYLCPVCAEEGKGRICERHDRLNLREPDYGDHNERCVEKNCPVKAKARAGNKDATSGHITGR